MISSTKMVHINAPVEKVFSFMSDPRNQLEIWPSLMDVRNVQSLENGGSDYDWTYKMAGMKFDGSSETLRVIPNKQVEVISKGGIDSHWLWNYAEENGGTALTVTVEYTIPFPVLGKLAEPIVVKQNDRELDVLLANLKVRLEATEPASAG